MSRLGLIARLAVVPRTTRGLTQIFWDKINDKLKIAHPDATGDEIERVSRKGAVGGYASLDSTGKVPAAQLPAASGGGLATPAASGLVAVDTGTGTTYGRTIAGTSPVTVTNGDGLGGNPTIAMPAASGSQSGHLSSTDWTTFNGKAAGTHASSHQHGGSDQIATATPAANAIPKAGSAGTLADAWLSAILQAIGALSTTGLVARTGAGTVAARSIEVGTGLSVANADGASGNPIINLDSAAPSAASAVTRVVRAQPYNTQIVWDGDVGFSTGVGTTLTQYLTNTLVGLQAAVLNANSNWPVRTNVQNYRIGHCGTLKVRFRSDSAGTASHRFWIGYMTTVGTGSTPVGQGCGLNYDPAISPNWQVFAFDGTTITRTDTGVVYASSTHYFASVRTDASGVYCRVWVAGDPEPADTSHTTNLPSSSTNMYQIWLIFRSAAGTSTVVHFGQQYSAEILDA